jgi:hypothetical protein
MDDLDPRLRRAVDAARRPVPVDPRARARLDHALRREAGGSLLRRALRWLLRPTVRLSPLGAMGVAAAVAVVALVLGTWLGAARQHRPMADAGTPGDAARVQFVLVAPGASQVSLVGDFNGWNPAATPLRPSGRGGVWTVDVPLKAGRYTYSFLVNGAVWQRDPAAPVAPGDDFGRPSSVILVQGGDS